MAKGPKGKVIGKFLLVAVGVILTLVTGGLYLMFERIPHV